MNVTPRLPRRPPAPLITAFSVHSFWSCKVFSRVGMDRGSGRNGHTFQGQDLWDNAERWHILVAGVLTPLVPPPCRFPLLSSLRSPEHLKHGWFVSLLFGSLQLFRLRMLNTFKLFLSLSWERHLNKPQCTWSLSTWSKCNTQTWSFPQRYFP